MATTATSLARSLADDSTRDSLQDYWDIQGSMGLGIEAAEVALAEAIESFESDCEATATAPVTTMSFSADRNAKPQPAEATNYPHHQPELEAGTLSPETMIELIAGHVHARLEGSLVDTLIQPLTNALIGPLTNALLPPLANGLAQPLTLALREPLANVLEQPLLDRVSASLHGSLPQDGALISTLLATLQPRLATQLSETLPRNMWNVSAPPPLDPIATSLSGFQKRKDTSSRVDTANKKHTLTSSRR